MKTTWIEEAIAKCENKIRKTAQRVGDELIFYAPDNGAYVKHESNDLGWWTNGFWPGILWLLYRDSKDEVIRAIAESADNRLDEVLYGYDRVDHDTGFMWKISAVAEYELTGNDDARKKGMLAASLLASRYCGYGEYIRSWNSDERANIAIVDCMMNLPILYWASEQIKDSRFAWIANKFADTVIDKFIRPDGSVINAIKFKEGTGEVQEYISGAIFAPNSSWSRGVAWALYGFALSYKFTGERKYYDAAKQVANFYIAASPEDYVPYKYFKDPVDENSVKDTSAAACAASGLLLLAELADEFDKNTYQKAGEKIVFSLYSNYTEPEEYEPILHSVCIAGGHRNVIYADYFYYEALKRLQGKTGLFE